MNSSKYLSHYVISKFKRYRQKKCSKCVILHSFVKENSIALAISQWENGKYFNVASYCISYRNGHFNFYLTRKNGERKCRIIEASGLNNYMSHRRALKDQYNPKIKSGIYSGLCKTAKKRLYKVLKDFCKSKGVQLKHLSKDPITLIKQLCYPGLQILNEDASKIKTGKCGIYAKIDLTRSILGNTGSKSRRLLLDAIRAHSQSFEPICVITKTIRKLHGVDKAQSLLENLSKFKIIGKINQTDFRNVYRIRDVEKDYSKFLSRFTVHQTEKLFSVEPQNHSILEDTARMVAQVEQIPGFDNLNDLHDKLSEAVATEYERAQRKKNAERDALRLKDIEISPKFKTLLDNWNNERFSLKFPKNGVELCEWSKIMSNCVASYEQEIRNGNYCIIGIFNGDELKYNIGFELYQQTNNLNGPMKQIFRFHQWSGKRNGPLLRKDRDILKPLFENGLGIIIQDNWREPVQAEGQLRFAARNPIEINPF